MFLLTASVVFCTFGSLSTIPTLLLSALISYLAGLALLRGKGGGWVLGVGIALQLLLFASFRWLSFSQIAAPLGLSFFIFKSISYLIDAWRDREKGTRSFFALALYLSFFPQLTAGPITRFSGFAPQLRSPTISAEKTALGLKRFFYGLSKKLLLAVPLGELADAAFSCAAPDMRLAWLGAAAYMLQIFFDFAGYSDMAIGLGGLFGFETAENFNYPYIAASIGDFWRRWHISLSTWFRDYVYIPLGGNRKGKARAALHKLIVFLLCGLWHGTGLTFLLWGLCHGLLSAGETLVGRDKLEKLPIALRRVFTLLAVLLTFVLFRAGSVAEAARLFGAMFAGISFSAANTLLLLRLLNARTVLALVAGAALSAPLVPWLSEKWKAPRAKAMLSYAAALLLLMASVLELSSGGFAPFIYAQF